ncbi:thioredoxin family protein [Longibacter salinarum]|uniref:Thioredoxin family protein n=1 Tax=Longibacter salinarum TaxID=1850348 RepID=A0A2A8D0G3_9BACT|nr:thioredoxin family protein [Longibacter salinarum]PEN14287.1 thioredoxin family protein [Longibacter salinarum]
MILRRSIATFLTLLLIVGLGPLAAQAQQAQVNQPAPDFTLQAADGETHSLSDFEGKYVVLEWLNYGCPFVQKHYQSGNMQKLQKEYTEKDVVWLSIVSSAEGKQGYYPPDEMVEQKKKHDGEMTAILMDPSGEVGQTYGARVTPHMYVINPEGQLIYMGGIDDKPTTDVADIEGATNYVQLALDAAMNGEEVEIQTAKPYGCTVKYAAR